MKKVFLSFLALIMLAAAGNSAAAQQATRNTISWDSQQREYLLYTPANCDTTQPRALLLALHGLGQQVDDLDAIAHISSFVEQTGWICVVPQALDASLTLMGTPVSLGACWNAGITASVYNTNFPLNSNVDDAGFLLALLDTLQAQYAIPADSLFISGISMGGFMTHRMLIEHGDRFAAAVPISGTIANTLENSAVTHGAHPDIMHIHGTADDVVTWDGDFTFRTMNLHVNHIGSSVDSCISFWTAYNQCDATPVTDTLADRCDDGLLFVRHTYDGGIDSSRVVLLEVQQGVHTWYGNSSIYDVDYLSEIYSFCTGRAVDYPVAGIASAERVGVKLFPNPAAERLSVVLPTAAEMRLYDMQGSLVMSRQLPAGVSSLDVSALPRGCYFMRLSDGSYAKVMVASGR